MSQTSQHRTLTASLGGEVATWIAEISGVTYECPLCGRSMTAIDETEVRGYQHRDGLDDGEETSWKAYIECPDCEFELTYDQFSGYRLTG